MFPLTDFDDKIGISMHQLGTDKFIKGGSA